MESPANQIAHDKKILQFVTRYHVVTVFEIATFGCIIGFSFTLGTTIWWKIGFATTMVSLYHYLLIWLDQILHPKSPKGGLRSLMAYNVSPTTP